MGLSLLELHCIFSNKFALKFYIYMNKDMWNCFTILDNIQTKMINRIENQLVTEHCLIYFKVYVHDFIMYWFIFHRFIHLLS